MAEFRRRYLKTEILPKELSETIDSLVEIRQGSDYDLYCLKGKSDIAIEECPPFCNRG